MATQSEKEDRQRKKKKQQQSKLGLWLGLAAGGAVLLVLVVVLVSVIIYRFWIAEPPPQAKLPVAPPVAPVVQFQPPPAPVPQKDKFEIGEKKRPVEGIRLRINRIERLNELRELGRLYLLYQTTFNKPPQTVQEFVDYIKRDAPTIKQAIDEKYFIVMPKVTAGNGIVAYEFDPDTTGKHGTVGINGTPEDIATQDLIARLKEQGSQ